MSINEEIKEALTELVRLKDYKKKHGKDDRYVVEQPFAWKRARVLLKRAKKQKCTACSGSGRYKDGKCGACEGTGED